MKRSPSLPCALGLLALALGLAACPGKDEPADAADHPDGMSAAPKLMVVCTTGMLADAAAVIGGERVEVHGLMGPGVDPHLYKARPSDMELLGRADLIIFHGLHLEAKLADVLGQLGKSRSVLAAAQEALPEAALLTPPGSGSAHDPHVWFDVELWMLVCERIAAKLQEQDPPHAAAYAQNLEAYLPKLRALHDEVKALAAGIPAERRVLVTAHDAFNYFGRKYGFEVVGLQGISTEAEAGTGDVRQLTDLIVERRLPAIFVESSVPVRNIEALIAAAKARGHAVRIGGSLFSDALGDAGTPEGTYIGMVEHNIKTIAAALTDQPAAAGAGGQD